MVPVTVPPRSVIKLWFLFSYGKKLRFLRSRDQEKRKLRVVERNKSSLRGTSNKFTENCSGESFNNYTSELSGIGKLQ